MCVRLYIGIYVCMFACMCVCMCVCVYVCAWVCVGGSKQIKPVASLEPTPAKLGERRTLVACAKQGYPLRQQPCVTEQHLGVGLQAVCKRASASRHPAAKLCAPHSGPGDELSAQQPLVSAPGSCLPRAYGRPLNDYGSASNTHL